MPTGYTHKIKDGQTFEAFVLGCARAFGALVTMRDEPADAVIPEKFEVSDYHEKEIAKAKQRAAEIESMSFDDVLKACEAEHIAALASWQKRKAEDTDLYNKYNAMLAEVLNWEPPTPDHVKLKEFMVEQLQTSRKFDCGLEWDKEPKAFMPSEWIARELAAVRRNIEYHSEAHAKEIARVESRNKWISALRESLKTKKSVDTEFPEAEYLLQIEQAARGSVSGTLAEWPLLKVALSHYGHDLPDTTPASEVRRVCQQLVNSEILF